MQVAPARSGCSFSTEGLEKRLERISRVTSALKRNQKLYLAFPLGKGRACSKVLAAPASPEEPPRLPPPRLGARFGRVGALGSGPQVLGAVSQTQNPAMGAAELLLELPWGASSKGCPHIREE